MKKEFIKVEVSEPDLVDIWREVKDEWSGPATDILSWSKERREAFLKAVKTRFGVQHDIHNVQVIDRDPGQLKGITLTITPK